MNFKLVTFAKNEIKPYAVRRLGEYDIHNPKPEETFTWEMLIYKKTLKVLVADSNDGLHTQGQLNGKIWKKYELKKGDIIEVFGLDYRVIEIIPRIYTDFYEFTLELMRNGE